MKPFFIKLSEITAESLELSALRAGLKDERRTSNIQRRTSNKEFCQFINWRSEAISSFIIHHSMFKRIFTLPLPFGNLLIKLTKKWEFLYHELMKSQISSIKLQINPKIQ